MLSESRYVCIFSGVYVAILDVSTVGRFGVVHNGLRVAAGGYHLAFFAPNHNPIYK
jgi:hypothetical protein